MTDQNSGSDGNLPNADRLKLDSSPPLEQDAHRLGLGGRSSSPAKRTRDERDAEDHLAQEQPGTPPSKPRQVEHFSPLPSRSKEPGSARRKESNGDDSAAATSVPEKVNVSFDDQYQRIMEITRAHPQSENDVGYILPASWFLRVVSRTTSGLSEGHDKALREGDVGPIDTRCLLPSVSHSDLADLEDNLGRPFFPIDPSLERPHDFEIVPKPAWDLLEEWYGIADGAPTICRYLHNTNPDSNGSANFVYELHPPIFQVHKVTSDRDNVTDVDRPTAARLVASRSEPYQSFLRRVKTVANIPMEKKVRAWRMLETPTTEDIKSELLTPDSSPTASTATSPQPRLTINCKAFDQLVEGIHRELVDVEDNTANPKFNGRSTTVGTFGFQTIQTIILEEQLRTGTKGTWASDKNRNALKRNTRDSPKPEKSAQESIKNRGATIADRPNAGSMGVLTRGRNKKIRGKGAVGLQNLGNTCYMNSALQCIRAVEELTWYFLGDMYKSELNSDNPLGHSGAIAKAYAGLVAQFYESNASFSPRNFRGTVGRCQPLFSGYGQQDSQEFLSFLIDGLHEDLNRIQRKPYIENPDSDDSRVRDSQYIKELGEIYRENHRKRNDSVAQDLFTGFYKNTMVCPECDKVSVTFDPYAQVTLQLPVENSFKHTLRVAPWSKAPLLVDLEIDVNSSFRQVKEHLAKKIGAPTAQRLIVFEEYNSKIYKIFDDHEVLSEASIQAADLIWAVELDRVPTNMTKRRAKANFYNSHGSEGEIPNMESAMADCMAVPLVHRLGQRLMLWPTFFTLTRDEAMDATVIQSRILERIQTMTTRNLVDDLSLTEKADNLTEKGDDLTEDSDTVMTIGEEIPEHSHVQAKSIGSEDDVVNVSVSQDVQPNAQGEPLKMPKHLLDMFSVGIYCGDREVIPVNKPTPSTHNWESIEDRVQRIKSQESRSTGGTASSWDKKDADMGSEDELACEDEADQSSSSFESDIAIPPPISRHPNRTLKHLSHSNSESLTEEDYFLVRLGEGLLLNWQPEAYDGLFEGSDGHDLRGRDTAKVMEKLPDAELAAKRQRLQRRRKDGVALADCFTESSKSEVLSEDNAWYCNRCKELRRATKTLELWTVPDILIVHLKRFSTQSRLRDKIDILVDFPIEGLDLTGRVGLDEGKSLVYDLFAVDKHFGGLGGGHYTANAKNFMDGNWYDYNDGFVSPCSPQSAVASAAYLLFYRRRTSRPLGPGYLQELVSKHTELGTRSSSESGEGQPGDPSSPNGSLTASQEVGADHQPRQMPDDELAVGVSGGRCDLAMKAKSGSHEELPSYDEGISMDDDSDGNSAAHHGFGGAGHLISNPSWGFDSLNGTGDSELAGPVSDEETLNDADSMNQEHGSTGGATSPSITGMSPCRGTSPACDDFSDEGAVERVQPAGPADDVPVHNIHLTETGEGHMDVYQSKIS